MAEETASTQKTEDRHATVTAAAEIVSRLVGELAERPPRPRVPGATYRLQLNSHFTFRDATRIVPYLAALGITDVYTSPQLKANPGSQHGYDIVDYGALNPELGSPADYAAFTAALKRHRMGQLADFVPNHMGIARGANKWWLDVLENGQSSPYADYFDIDWAPLKPELHGQVLLPMLGEHYGAVLESGELELRFEDGAFTLWYHETPFPIAPPTYPMLLRPALTELQTGLPEDSPQLQEYQSIITALERLPGQDERDPEQIAERQREQIVAKRRLAELTRTAPEIAAAIEGVVEEFNGEPGNPASFDRLDQLLEAQSYRLASWRVAAEEINYRRFFAINELAAVRQEDPAVFAAAHALIFRWLAEGKISGLRIDHSDGLWDPAGYFADVQRGYLLARLRHRFRELTARHPDLDWERLQPVLAQALATAQTDHPDLLQCPLYVVAEKILEEGESIPADWAIDGTVGYDFLHDATGLFVNAANRRAFDTLYARFIGERLSYATLVYEMKKLIMRVGFASEVNVLTRTLDQISEQNRRTRDFTTNNLRFALVETIACFPIYRTYIRCETESPLSDADRRAIETAIAQAKRRNPASDPSVFNLLRATLTLENDETVSPAEQAERCRFAMRFQQLSGPVMAKGVEDTVFYIYNRLVSLNEVGGNPQEFGTNLTQFHRQQGRRRRQWPHAMLASSTHDTKRGEDVRARINVLSELPREWRAAINRWSRLNRRHKTTVEGEAAPARNDEYLYYQTLLGVWPTDGKIDANFVDRLVAYMAKATKEAQVRTSWINPNAAYDEATERFVRTTLDRRHAATFLENFALLAAKVAEFGMYNGLAQQLLKLTVPGVPDIYQGTELWGDRLVDPDNRRPVDYERRQQLLTELQKRRPSRGLAADLLAQKQDGRIKLYLTSRALAFRHAHPALFADGDYLPLMATGTAAEHVCAFSRRFGDDWIVVAVPRLLATLLRGESGEPLGSAVWGAARLPLPSELAGRRFRHLFTGETCTVTGDDETASLALAEIFASFPAALLVAAKPFPKEA